MMHIEINFNLPCPIVPMNVAILNPSFGDDFVRVARWAAKSRGRVQRHPEYLLTAAQVLLDQGHDTLFVEAAARTAGSRLISSSWRRR